MLYLTSHEALVHAVAERRAHAAEIRERMDAFALCRYGIPAMSDTVQTYLGLTNGAAPVAVLARQIVSVCAEDIAFEIGAELLGCTPLPFTFGRDAFTKNNHDKLHRVKIPWISWSKKGNMTLAYERISRESNDTLEGRPLDRILTLRDVSLLEHHQQLRMQAGLERTVQDVFLLDAALLAQATNRPEFIYREEGDREVRCPIGAASILLPRDRPPASWYYPYYLSWFLDGSLVLFETYENPIGEVGHAKKLFEQAMHDVYAATGYMPLVVKIPPLSKEMLYCNTHLLEQPDAVTRIAAEAGHLPRHDTVEFFQAIADRAIRYR